MKTKYLLAALALPAMFAACSQEDIFTDANLPQSTELLGKVAGDVEFEFGTQSRLVWGATGEQDWEANDEFSLFWVNSGLEAYSTEDGEKLFGNANALYKKNGNTFTSENILYVGKHLMVYPVNKTHATSKAIAVEVGATQDASIALGKRSVYTNESLLTIDAMPLKESDKKEGIIYAAGYQQPVEAVVKPLSSNLVLNLNFDMPSTISEVTVKSVSLIADKAIFPANGYLTATDDKVAFEPNEKKNSIVLKMAEGTKVKKSNSTLVAQMALLPVLTNDATTYTIEVVTNYGVVTIAKAKYVTDKNGMYLFAGNTAANQAKADFKLEDTDLLNLQQELALTKENGLTYTYRGKEYTVAKEDASYGKRITANVKVMMSEASIEGMKVANSQELIDAYNTYTLLGKTGEVNFVLYNEKPFEMTPAAVAKVLSNKNINLKQELNDTIKLTGAHTAIPTFVVKDGNANKTLFDASGTKVVLGAEGTWALDVDAAAEANKWAEVINGGTLTISESNPTSGAVALTTPVTNAGKVSFSGNVEMPVAYNQTKDGETTVPATSYVDLSDGGSINGKVAVNGGLYANKGVVYVEEGAAIEVAGSFLTASTGTMHNLGTITLKDKGTVYVSTNQAGTGEDLKMGSIILAERNSSAKVEETGKQGYIKWACGDVDSFTKQANDAFNTLIIENDFYANGAEGVEYIEINGSKVSVYPKPANNGTVSDKTWELTDILVKEGKTLVVTKGMTLSANNIKNDGRIEVFGQLNSTTVTGKGKIYYYNGQVNVDNVEDLKAAVNTAKLVVLTTDMTLDAPLEINNTVTVDLNGKTVKMDASKLVADGKAKTVFKVTNGTVTFKNGTVDASYAWIEEDRVAPEDAATQNVSVYAIYATGGTINIEGGVYKTGSDKMAAYNGQLAGTPVIGLAAGATANISGGEFEAMYPCSEGNAKYIYTPLRLELNGEARGTFKITGGTFVNYNPNAALDMTVWGGSWTNHAKILGVVDGKTYTTTKVVNAANGDVNTTTLVSLQYQNAWDKRKYTVGVVAELLVMR